MGILLCKAEECCWRQSRAGGRWRCLDLERSGRRLEAHPFLGGRGRDAGYAQALMDVLRSRITTRVQLTTDGHRAYLEAVEEAFGADIDYGMLVKLYGAETGGQGHERKYSPLECIGASET